MSHLMARTNNKFQGRKMRTNFEHLILNRTDQSKYFPISLLVLEVHMSTHDMFDLYLFLIRILLTIGNMILTCTMK